MPTKDQTVKSIIKAKDWNKRVAQFRLVPDKHGTGDHIPIYAEVARELYVPNLVPDFAYIHEEPFYGEAHFLKSYDLASRLTAKFTKDSAANISATLQAGGILAAISARCLTLPQPNGATSSKTPWRRYSKRTRFPTFAPAVTTKRP